MMNKITKKLRQIKVLLSEGKYKEAAFIVFPSVIRVRMIYSYFRIKFRSLISSHVAANSLTKGGGGGHENVIWRLWLQGEDNAPEVCKACLRSLRYWHSDKKIITLDYKNMSDYITLPDYITQKYEQGLICNTHFSDIVRAELLSKYGGTWIDSTVYCTGRNFEDVTRLPLFVFQTKGNAAVLAVASSWFIVSDANNPIITLTRDLLFKYWENYNYDLVIYFFFHMLFKMATKAYPDEWRKVPYFSNRPPHEMSGSLHNDYSEERMKYFAGISDFHKLTYKFNPEILTPSSILQHVIDSYK